MKNNEPIFKKMNKVLKVLAFSNICVESGIHQGLNYRKYANGDVEYWGIIEKRGTYAVTGSIWYGTFHFNLPFKETLVEVPTITYTVNSGGTTFPSIHTATMSSLVTMYCGAAANEQARVHRFNIHIKGKWK